MALFWDSDGTDIDLHVVSPDGQHVFYGNRAVPNGGALDVDVTTGHGPEIYANPSPLKGAYHVFVNYWGNFSQVGYNFDESKREHSEGEEGVFPCG